MARGTGGDEGKEKQTLCSNVFYMLRLHCSIELQRLSGFLRFIAHVAVYVCELLCMCVWRQGHSVCVCVCVCVCSINWQTYWGSDFPQCWLCISTQLNMAADQCHLQHKHMHTLTHTLTHTHTFGLVHSLNSRWHR